MVATRADEAHVPSAPSRRPGKPDGSPRSGVQRHLVFLRNPRLQPDGAPLGVVDVDDSLEQPPRSLVAGCRGDLHRPAETLGRGLHVAVTTGLEPLFDRARQLSLATVVSDALVDSRRAFGVVRPDGAHRRLGGGGALPDQADPGRADLVRVAHVLGPDLEAHVVVTCLAVAPGA